MTTSNECISVDIKDRRSPEAKLWMDRFFNKEVFDVMGNNYFVEDFMAITSEGVKFFLLRSADD